MARSGILPYIPLYETAADRDADYNRQPGDLAYVHELGYTYFDGDTWQTLSTSGGGGSAGSTTGEWKWTDDARPQWRVN